MHYCAGNECIILNLYILAKCIYKYDFMSFILNNLDLDEAVFKVLEPNYPSRTTASHFLGKGVTPKNQMQYAR